MRPQDVFRAKGDRTAGCLQDGRTGDVLGGEAGKERSGADCEGRDWKNHSPLHSFCYLSLRQKDWASVLGTALSCSLPGLQKCGQSCVAVLTLHEENQSPSPSRLHTSPPPPRPDADLHPLRLGKQGC